MKRHLSVVSAMLLLAATAPAFAATDYAAQVVAQLKSLGFDEIGVSRTLLGRTRIMAATDRGYREIVLDPRTGEILRDLWQEGRGDHGDRSGAGGGSQGNGGEGDKDHDGGGDDGNGQGGED
jgi:hypothetical protein